MKFVFDGVVLPTFASILEKKQASHKPSEKTNSQRSPSRRALKPKAKRSIREHEHSNTSVPSPTCVKLEDDIDLTTFRNAEEMVVKLEPCDEPPLKKRIILDDEEKAKIEFMFKSKKKKHQEKRLNDDVFADRLKSKPISLNGFPITLGLEYTQRYFPRSFLTAVYGGNGQKTFGGPGPKSVKRTEHPYRDFMFLNLDFHPFAPQIPGMPGLWLSREDEPERLYKDKKMMLFSRHPDRRIWIYLGQYVVVQGESLSKSEWLSQPIKVRTIWANELADASWGRTLCNRIEARKESPEVATLVNKYMSARRRGVVQEDLSEPYNTLMVDLNKRKSYLNTTPNEVMTALDSGIERLGLFTLECIGYNEGFAITTAQKFETWDPLQNDVTRRQLKDEVKEEIKKEEALSSPPRAIRGPARKKRKYTEDSESESAQMASNMEDLGDDGVVLNDQKVGVYRSRGTRSRPQPVRSIGR